MPGGFHILYGLLLGLPIWAIANKNMEKGSTINEKNVAVSPRWPYSLLLVFILNNHFGPDFGGIINELGELLESEAVFMFGAMIHSYFGFMLFAPVYTIIWYIIVFLLDRARLKKFPGENQIPSYSQVYLCVLFGGLNHFFVDNIAHVLRYSDPPSLRGSFNLYVGWDLAWVIIYIVFYIVLFGLFGYYLARQMKKNHLSLGVTLKKCLGSRLNWLLLFGLGLSVLNMVLLFSFLTVNNILLEKTSVLSWNDYIVNTVYFSLGHVLTVTWIYPAGTSTWILVVLMCTFISLFIWAYIQNRTVKIGKHSVSLAQVILIIFVMCFIILYFLQPWIGNISNQESDFGGFIFVWVTIGSTIVGFSILNHFMDQTLKPSINLPKSDS